LQDGVRRDASKSASLQHVRELISHQTKLVFKQQMLPVIEEKMFYLVDFKTPLKHDKRKDAECCRFKNSILLQ